MPSAATPPTAGSSLVDHRYRLDDLTVSGRTTAEADAIDAQLSALEVAPTGSAYYGRAPTIPRPG